MMQQPFPPASASGPASRLLTPPTLDGDMGYGGGGGGDAGMGAPPPPTALMPTPQPPPRVVRTALERWSLREHGKLPDLLESDGELASLAAWGAEEAKDGRERWQGRNTRMSEEHKYFSLAARPGVAGHEHESAADMQARGTHEFRLPLPYSVVVKLTSMMTGAGHRANLPSESVLDTAKVQQVENWMHHWWRETRVRLSRGRGGDPLRQIAHHLVLDGWATVLVMPNSDEPEFPFRTVIAEPSSVFPREDAYGDFVSCTHQYRMTVRDAREEYPEAADMLDGQKDTETIVCSAYWDVKYHFIGLSTESGGSAGVGGGGSGRSTIIKRPIRHGVVGLDGRPLFPWLIFLPMGDLSGGIEMDGSDKPDTALVGPGVLYPVLESYDRLCQILAMLLTNVARSANPPSVEYIREGAEAPQPLSFQPGARNIKVFANAPVQILDTAPNPADFQPLMTLLIDALDKALLPSVSYGINSGVQSGYGVGLLQNPALDVLVPFKGESGLQGVLQAVLRRGLEITAMVTAQTHPTLSMTTTAQRSGFLGRPGRRQFQPALIFETGVQVEVQFGEVTPQDRAALMGVVGPMVLAGLLDRYTARQELGYDDPLLIAMRIALQDAMESPEAVQMLGDTSAFAGDPDVPPWLVELAKKIAMQNAMMGRQQGQGSQPAPTPLPTSAVPLEAQPAPTGSAALAPAREDPAAQIQRTIDQGNSRGSGGSPAAY